MKGIATVTVVQHERASSLPRWFVTTVRHRQVWDVYEGQVQAGTHTALSDASGQPLLIIETRVEFDAYASEEG